MRLRQRFSRAMKWKHRKGTEMSARVGKTIKDVISQFFVVQQEMIKDRGEDSYLLNVKEKEAVIAVFDGCGGAGAKTYEKMNHQTGAYIASRALVQGANQWFETQYGEQELDDKNRAKKLKENLDQQLEKLKKTCGPGSGVRGTIIKELPSTLALCTVSLDRSEARVTCYWSGDSRNFVLDRSGLHQMTRDDVEDADPMMNLTECEPMNNLVSASLPYEIHVQTFYRKLPCMILSATDGCFDTLKSPMEFEKLLLQTLQASRNIQQWQDRLHKELKGIAGDDYTMAVLILGFATFHDLREHFEKRLQYMKKYFPCADKMSRKELLDQWEDYRKNYELYQREPERYVDR